MKKLILMTLTFTILITAVISPVYTWSVSAGSDLQQKVSNTAKIALGLYLISQVSRVISDTYLESEDTSSDKDNSLDNQDRLTGQDNQDSQSSPDTQNNQDFHDKSNTLERAALEGKVIVIDPGHGGRDPGAVGKNGLKEKDVNLDIAVKLKNILIDNTSADVYLTRETDCFLTLQQRTDFAFEKNADIFISIHQNADKARTGDGIETYAHYNTSKNTWALAWYIHERLLARLGFADRGLKADNFHVIREASSLKSVLLEIGFISNSDEERALAQENVRFQAASAIYEGIINYFKNKN